MSTTLISTAEVKCRVAIVKAIGKTRRATSGEKKDISMVNPFGEIDTNEMNNQVAVDEIITSAHPKYTGN